MVTAIICSCLVTEASAAVFFPTGLARVNRFHAAYGQLRQDKSKDLVVGQYQSEMTAAVTTAHAPRPALGNTVELAQPAYAAGGRKVRQRLFLYQTARAFLTNSRNNVVPAISAATADAQDSSDALMEAAISGSIQRLESNMAHQQRTGLLRRFMLATASAKAAATATAASSKGPAAMALPVDETESGFVASEDDWFKN
jgi:hypothetical protein